MLQEIILTPPSFAFWFFVQKMDSSGNSLWFKSFEGSSLDNNISITTDASGNVYSVGYFSGRVDFDPGAGIFYLTSQGGSVDTFVQKNGFFR